MSELFHTIDFGKNYTIVHSKELQAFHNSKVCFTDTDIRYSINYANDHAHPVISNDKGATWKYLSGIPDLTENFYSINTDRQKAQRVIISNYSKIYFSADSGKSFSAIHNATTDAGAHVSGVFFNDAKIYICTNDGLLISENGGSNFTLKQTPGIPTDEVIFSFTGAISGNTMRFFCLTGSKADVYVGLQGTDYWGFTKGIYSIDNLSGNWTACTNGIDISKDFLMFLTMAENNINVVYAGGSRESVPVIMKTENGGTLWKHVLLSKNNENTITGWSGYKGDKDWWYGECPFGIATSSLDPNRIIIADMGFIHVSLNGGDSWQQAYINPDDENPPNINTPKKKNYKSCGLENTSCWQVFWMDNLNLYGAYSDINAIRSQDGGQSWSFNYTGHEENSMYRIIKHTNGNLYAATSTIHDIYQSTRLGDKILDAGDGRIIFSTNNGLTWNLLHDFDMPVYWIVSTKNSNKLYASVIHSTNGGIFVCNDVSSGTTAKWTKLDNPPRTEGHPAVIQALDDGNIVCTYSGRRASAFTASSGVFLYDTTSKNWSDVSDPGTHYWTRDIIIDPHDATQNTWYVCVYSGWGGAPNNLGGIYHTSDRGQSWKRICDLDRVSSCTIHPDSQNVMYVATEQEGLWICTNLNAQKPDFKRIDSYRFSHPERIFFNPFNHEEVWVASFGNGMSVGSDGINSILISNNISYKNQFAIKQLPDKILFTADISGRTRLKIFDLKGRTIFSKEFLNHTGTTTLSWNIKTFSAGSYIYKIKNNGKVQVGKLFLYSW